MSRTTACDIDWSVVHLFWGDDRYVPHDDDDRNDKQARDALLERIVIPAGNVHAMPAATASSARTSTRRRWPTSECWPRSRTTANRRPPSMSICSAWAVRDTSTRCSRDTAAVREKDRLVVGVTDSPKPPPQRITLTLPAIRRAREVWLVVGGADKAEAVAAAIGGADPVDVPAAGAVGREKTVWLLDEEAAALLNR